MNKKLLSFFQKPFSTLVLWIGGSLATVTAVFSAIGFLVLRSHHDLLGITGIVPMPVENWSVEGARFVYNSVFYSVAAIGYSGWVLLTLLFALAWGIFAFHASFQEKRRKVRDSKPLRGLVLCVPVIILVIVTGLAVDYTEPSHLLMGGQKYDTPLKMRSELDSIRLLRARYALLVSLIVLLFTWLTFLPKVLTNPSDEEKPHPAVWHILLAALWFLSLIPLLFLPISYGKMAKSNNFSQVQLLEDLDRAAQPKYKGWLLYEGGGRIVLYKGVNAIEKILIVHHDDFAEIQILKYENIFAAKLQ